MDEATRALVEATEHYGVFLSERQTVECLSLMQAGKTARQAVGSLSLYEVGIGSL